jgi:antitoxin component of MazEF toxin-antitoxin module
MKRTVLQSGNKMKKGIKSDFVNENGSMRINRVAAPKIPLKRLLAKVTAKNIHSETEWGPAVGKEVW